MSAANEKCRSIEALAKKGEKNILRNIFKTDSDSSDEAFSDEDVHPAQVNETLFDDITKLSPDCTTVDSSIITHVSCDGTKVISLRQQKQRGIAHQLWPAASFLCNYLELNPSHLCRSEVHTAILELGAGIGLCGIFAASLGCNQVILTDLEEAVEGLNANIEMNGLSGTVIARELRWGDQDQMLDVLRQFNPETHGAPLVIAADCVYWEVLFEPFYQTIYGLVARGSTVLIAHVRRWKRDGKFFAMCRKTMNVEVLQEVVDSVTNEETGEERRRVTRIYKIDAK